MNFPLADIELHLDEDCLLRGEQLLEEGKVNALLELERHLWLLEVEDEAGRYEVELRISPSKVLQSTCDCAAFRKAGECAHIAAGLLALRRHISEKQKKTERAPSRNKRPKTSLSTGLILENISPEAIADFVRQYAKTNRSFAIALKTRFAPDVPTPDNKGKFLELLDGAINAARKADRSISKRGIRSILGVAGEMQTHMKQAMALQHFTDAADMAQSIIEKITPLLRRAGEAQQELREAVAGAFLILSELPERNAPPALLDSLWTYAAEESQKLIYRSNGIDRHFFSFLRSLSDSEAKAGQLRLLIAAQLGRYISEGRDPTALVLLQLQLLEESGKDMEAVNLVAEYLSAPEVLLFAVRHAAGKSDWNRMAMLAEAGLKLSLPPAAAGELEELLLQKAIRENAAGKIASLARSRFFKTLDTGYYRTLKAAIAENWQEHTDEILTRLRRLPFSQQKRRVIAAVLAEENRKGELLAYLQDAGSLDLLAEFGTALLPEMKTEVLQLYHRLLDQYLRGHVGPKPSQRVREIVEQLYRTGAGAIADALVEMIRAEYPERHTLREELQEF